MSNALARLRLHFDDALFQRVPGGMSPTERAEALAPDVARALEILSGTLQATAFDAYSAEGEIVIAASDLAVLQIAPRLTNHLAHTAPNLTLRFAQLNKRKIIAQLDNGDITLAIGTFGRLPARIRRTTYGTDSFVCIARKNHPTIGQSLSLEKYLETPHALMTLSADRRGIVDDALKKLGKSRHIAMTSANFLLMPELISRTDLLATVPASLGSVAERAGCQVLPPPLALPSWSIDLITSQRTEASALGAFAIAAIKKSCLNPIQR